MRKRVGSCPSRGAAEDHLQRHDAVEADLPGPVDDAHAAATEHAEDFVARHARQRARLGRQDDAGRDRTGTARRCPPSAGAAIRGLRRGTRRARMARDRLRRGQRFQRLPARGALAQVVVQCRLLGGGQLVGEKAAEVIDRRAEAPCAGPPTRRAAAAQAALPSCSSRATSSRNSWSTRLFALNTAVRRMPELGGRRRRPTALPWPSAETPPTSAA